MSPAVVGLILNFRDAARTLVCAQSLLREGVTEVWVWDNSADGGASADALRAQAPDSGTLRILESPINLGFAAGVNRALARLRIERPGARVLLINNDAVLLPGAVAALEQALNAHAQAWIAYPDIDHGGRVIGTVYYHRLTGLLQLQRRWLPGSFAYASGCCLLIEPRHTGDALFDERFFMYGEDIALGYRLRARPGALVHVPLCLVRHEGSASSGMATAFYESRMVAAHLLLARVLGRGPCERALLLTMRLPVLFVRALLRSLRYSSLRPWRALYEGFLIARTASR